jgi:hypothetical protein|tara:strand:+ start:308 stop:991 length:684 start_codon:yes stop_codon:yes gene_type:complete
MATVRQYGYYVKGNQVAIVEKDTQFDNDVNSKDYGPGSDRSQWKSPLATVADGLEIQYVYSPSYFIESTDVSTQTVSGWDQDNDGNFRLRASGSTDWTTSPDLSSVTYIVLQNAGRFNGLHKVSSVTNNRIVTTTKVSASTSETLFEETVTLYYDVNALSDESDTIDLPNYLSKALVYYVKAKVAEDMMNLEAKEYFMKEFRKMVEKYNNTRVAGPRMQSSGPYAIR